VGKIEGGINLAYTYNVFQTHLSGGLELHKQNWAQNCSFLAKKKYIIVLNSSAFSHSANKILELFFEENLFSSSK